MAVAMNMVPIVVAIAQGQSLSPQVNLGANTLHGIALPASWTPANLTFQVSPDGGVTWLEMSTISGTVLVEGNQYIALDPQIWRGVNCLKIRSGTLSQPVAQGVNCMLTLMTRQLT